LKISASGRLVPTLLSSTPLAALSVPTHDIALIIAAAAILLATAIDYAVALMMRRRARVSIEVPTHCVRMWLGTRREMRIRIDAPKWVRRLEVDSAVARIDEVRSADGVIELRLVIDPPFCGVHSLGMVRLEGSTPLGLFLLHARIATDVEVIAYPRAWLLVIETLEILSRGGARAVGVESEVPSALRSHSGVYYATREYAVGDPLTRIDWKASARTLKLMIKEFREELASGIRVVLDDACFGPYTCDEIISTALSIALTAARISVPLVLELINESRSVHDLDEALAVLITKALNAVSRMAKLEPYEVIPPQTLRELEPILSKVTEPKWRAIASSELGQAETVFIVSAALSGIDALIERAEKALSRGASVRVYAPARPWIDFEDPEEAYIARRTQFLALKRLQLLGCDIKLTEKGKLLSLTAVYTD